MSDPIRVLIADDNPGMRQVLAELLSDEPSLDLVGIATNADEAATLVEQVGVDVALVDVRMPGGGKHATREIRSRSTRTRVIAFSAHGDREAVVGMVRAGAVSYLLKGTPGGQVIDAIHRVANGESILSQEATGPVVGELVRQLQRREDEIADRERKLDRVQQALQPGAMRIVYQPIVDLADRRRRGVEALARFDLSPDRTPDVWFAEAREVGLGMDLEVAAVREALTVLGALGTDEFLSVNVSPDVVGSPRFAEVLPAGSHPRVLVEITEHAPIPDYESLARCLEEPRRAGLRLAIDDAGAGYASLLHILRLDPDVIKLDMSLTRNLHTDRRRRALVAALVSFAAEIDAAVVAEGVETAAEMEELRRFRVPWGQGYLLGRPDAIEASSGLSRPGPPG